jgi:hypothetical protein
VAEKINSFKMLALFAKWVRFGGLFGTAIFGPSDAANVGSADGGRAVRRH